MGGNNMENDNNVTNVLNIMFVINSDYDVSYKLMGDDDNKLMILRRDSTPYIISINIKAIEQTAVWAVIKEYIELFQKMFVGCDIVKDKEFHGKYFTFIK
jgi:hypothetical protein